MESLLYDLITENIDIHSSCESQARVMPGYVVTQARYNHAFEQMNHLPDSESRKRFLEYESAGNAMTALLETAAVMVGFRMCLRLLTEVLRADS